MKIQIYGDSLMKAIVVDDNYKYRPLEKPLLAQLQADTGAEIVSQRVPADGTYSNQMISGMSVLVADMDAARQMLEETLLAN